MRMHADGLTDEGIDSYWDYAEEPEDCGSPSRGITCRHCGKTGLTWGCTFDEKWRLFEEPNKVHTCKEYRKESKW